MSFAKIKITVGSVDPLTHTGVTITLNLPDATIVLTGYPSFDAEALSQPNTFPLYSNSTITAQALKSSLGQALIHAGYGADKVLITYDTNNDAVALFKVYLGASISGSTSTPFSLQLTQEVIENLTVTNIQVSEADSNKCQMAKFTLSVAQGTPPYTIRRSGVEVANDLTFDFSRSDTARSFTITDSTDLSATFTLPFVRSRVGEVVFEQIAKPGGSDVKAIIQDDGKGAPLVWEYAVDNPEDRQSSNFFELLAPGYHLFYFWDNFGCAFSVGMEVDGFQHIDVRAVHNPINFLFERGTGNPYLLVRLIINNEDKGIFRANPYQTKNGNIQYLFAADEIIRQYMPSFDDYFSNLESPGVVQNMFVTVELQLLSEVDEWETQAIFVAVNAARQIGLEGEKLNDLLNNREPSYIFVHGQPGYIYWFEEGSFYREKLFLTADTVIERGGREKKIKVLPYCEGDIILKYLDRNGMYRFYRFTKNYERTVDTDEIGSIEHTFTSLSTGQGYQKSIGNKSVDKIKARAEKVPVEDLNILKDLYTSPRVYFHLGEAGTDNLSNWVLVKVKGDGIAKLPKRNFVNVEIEIELPANNEITML
jgi:hypothetical protein